MNVWPYKQTYLGDGVYASFDGYQVWLRTERGDGWHEIALEPSVFESLIGYVEGLNRAKRAQDAVLGNPSDGSEVQLGAGPDRDEARK